MQIKPFFRIISLVVLISGLLADNLHAQKNTTDLKGRYLVSGSASFTMNLDQTKTYFTSLNHQLGYFVGKKIAAGYALQASYSHLSPPHFSFEAGPFFRYYTIGNLFLEINPSYGIGTTSDLSNTKSRLLSLSGRLGYSIFLNEHIALEPKINILHTRNQISYSMPNFGTITSLDTSTILSFWIGFSKFF